MAVIGIALGFLLGLIALSIILSITCARTWHERQHGSVNVHLCDRCQNRAAIQRGDPPIYPKLYERDQKWAARRRS
jgi:hypothetical protein